ncbi:hypothetical protein PXK47_20395 [Phaeobacter gallaeciensis]|jgi:hypothetical protein|nr:hypothetical protein [Phaeobacter gallaeciensis]
MKAEARNNGPKVLQTLIPRISEARARIHQKRLPEQEDWVFIKVPPFKR